MEILSVCLLNNWTWFLSEMSLQTSNTVVLAQQANTQMYSTITVSDLLSGFNFLSFDYPMYIWSLTTAVQLQIRLTKDLKGPGLRFVTEISWLSALKFNNLTTIWQQFDNQAWKKSRFNSWICCIASSAIACIKFNSAWVHNPKKLGKYLGSLLTLNCVLITANGILAHYLQVSSSTSLWVAMWAQ